MTAVASVLPFKSTRLKRINVSNVQSFNVIFPDFLTRICGKRKLFVPFKALFRSREEIGGSGSHFLIPTFIPLPVSAAQALLPFLHKGEMSEDPSLAWF